MGNWTKGHLLMLFALLLACQSNYTPKPKGYFKLDLPEHKYQTYSSNECPFGFEFPTYAVVIKDSIYNKGEDEGPCWLNIGFPNFNGQIHLSYKAMEDIPIGELLEDMHQLTSKHIPRASSITETPLKNSHQVHGLLYEVGGEAASSVQFYLTDSTQHFVRCALYFYSTPNADSIEPVLKFIKEDILHMIDTWQWKEI